MAHQPPLTGLKVLEFAGLAPGPFAGLLLADAGASVLRIDRAVPGKTHTSSIAVDLKSPGGIAFIKELARHADIVIDPFRPGVLEKLGLGPDVLCAANPRLIFGRMTGFRRDGKYKDMAGHDINYLAAAGVLDLLGRKGERPTPPWNILGDFAGGGATLFQGVLLAVIARERTGKGQVVEANMVDGSSYLATYPRFALKTPFGDRGRGENLLDTGCPYYDTYETRDGKYMSVGALEPQFFKVLMQGLGLAGQGWEERRHDSECWPELRRVIDGAFKGKTRTEWEAVFDGTDACCVPVLSYHEMEGSAEREGDQRPPVTLRDTPLFAVRQDASDVSHGQGAGVEGGGYVGSPLAAGEGGEETLQQWFKWSKGREFDVQRGGLVWTGKSKL